MLANIDPVSPIQLVDARAKQFNEDVMGEVFNLDPGRETQLMDKEYLEKPFQLKFSAAKVKRKRQLIHHCVTDLFALGGEFSNRQRRTTMGDEF